MEKTPIKANVSIDKKTFRDFAVFDNIYRRRRWLYPVVFASILLVFALICFIIRPFEKQAILLGCVLLVVGFGLPAVYYGMFFSSIKAQIKKLDLEKRQPGYELELTGKRDGIHVRSGDGGGESTKYKWDSLISVYRVTGYTYLYVLQNKAFLIPDDQVEGGPDNLWALITSKLPAEKLHDRRRGK